MENQEMLKVLLVEDDDLDAKLVKYRLDEDPEHEFHLETVGTLESACGRIEQGDVDVILADLSLPDSADRTATLQTLTNKAANIPIVVLTGYSDFSFELKSVRNGIQDYVIKDQVTRHLLVRAILHAVERQRLKEQNKMLLEQLERLTLIDPLTETLNRRGLQKVLTREIEWVKRTDSSVLAILFDLDKFKNVNDRFGYTTGDKVLKQMTEEITKTLRATDYFSRIGGDEFIILLPETHLVDGMKVIGKVQAAISSMHLTASFGLIRVTEEINTVEELLRKIKIGTIPIV